MRKVKPDQIGVMHLHQVSNLLGIIGNELSKVGKLTLDMRVTAIECLQHHPIGGKFVAPQSRLLVDNSAFQFGDLRADQVAVVKPDLRVPGAGYLPEPYARQSDECEEWYVKGLS
jgi:hypothetical protein